MLTALARANHRAHTFVLLQMKEAKRLKEFLEDYDDERDDPKFYRFVGSFYVSLPSTVFAQLWFLVPRGSALQKRVRDREKEAESDERDRKREKEELEEIRQRLLAEGHPDPDAELQRVGPRARSAHVALT